MNASTLTLTPGTTPVPGAGVSAETTTRTLIDTSRTPTTEAEHALTRAGREDYQLWLSHVFGAAGCTHPIRLTGQIATIEADTGRLLQLVNTETMPDGVIYKPCGNRRTSVCPSCAETYRRDAYELIRTGLVGGKTVPASVAQHPAVFITLTAPSFGPVHTRPTTRDGRILPCRPRRQPAPCPTASTYAAAAATPKTNTRSVPRCAWTATTTTTKSSGTTKPANYGVAPASSSTAP